MALPALRNLALTLTFSLLSYLVPPMGLTPLLISLLSCSVMSSPVFAPPVQQPGCTPSPAAYCCPIIFESQDECPLPQGSSVAPVPPPRQSNFTCHCGPSGMLMSCTVFDVHNISSLLGFGLAEKKGVLIHSSSYHVEESNLHRSIPQQTRLFSLFTNMYWVPTMYQRHCSRYWKY